jgi:hypothetical protein
MVVFLHRLSPGIMLRQASDVRAGRISTGGTSGRRLLDPDHGPPYANGNICIGAGLNKIRKDVVNRSPSPAAVATGSHVF